MVGILALGLIFMMIWTLVKNALRGKQLSSDDSFTGTVELLIPVTPASRFYFEPWKEALTHFHQLSGRLKIHILIDGHHPLLSQWEDLRSQFPFFEIHSFTMRPQDQLATSWMIDQIIPKITSDVVIIGDPEIAASEAAFISTGHIVKEKNQSYLIIPQTARLNVLNETIAALNPTLSLVSVFGFRKFSKSISHPLMGLAQGWIAMPLETFKSLKLGHSSSTSWKQAITKQWDKDGHKFALAFGEKFLKRFYLTDVKQQLRELKDDWQFLWSHADRVGLWLYLVTIILWSFPIVGCLTNPFAAFFALFLLILYRFFTKIVFQESWGALALHLLGSLAILGSFVWWLFDKIQTKRRPSIVN